MKNWQSYIDRQKTEYLQTLFPADFAADMVVVIPCYDESDLCATLQNLRACDVPAAKVLVAVVVNSGVNSEREVVLQNRKTYDETLAFAKQNNSDRLRFFPFIFENLPRKHAGVGLARKIGMDLAVEHFLRNQNPEGIVISLDADCTVSPNFFTGIFSAYRQSEKLCCTVQNFRHRVENNHSRLENAIRQYERHIRYFSQMLRQIEFPYYFHTIGSAFSVAADAYVRVGGMGRQQGGEDFYFLQKVFALEKSKRLDDVFVYPLARFSDRIPFGTGPALQKIIDAPDGKLRTYSIESFLALKSLFDLRKSFFKQDSQFVAEKISALHPAVVQFAEETNTIDDIDDCNRNSATPKNFEKRFFHHFNAFKIIKFLNFSHESHFPLSPIDEIENNAHRFLDK